MAFLAEAEIPVDKSKGQAIDRYSREPVALTAWRRVFGPALDFSRTVASKTECSTSRDVLAAEFSMGVTPKRAMEHPTPHSL